MSDSQSRPARGRTTSRGGRGGPAGSRGPRPNKQNGDHASIDTSAEQGELAELKRRYSSQLTTLKEMFPGWSDADLVLAIEESDGDLQSVVENISEGKVSQFAEVHHHTKDRSRSKVKDVAADAGPALRGGPLRGERTERRGESSIRGGGRGRGSERGRGGFRGGARGGAAVGARTGGVSVPTADSPAWDLSSSDAKPDSAAVQDDKAAAEPEAPKPAAPAPAAAQAPPKKTWASMFATPKPAPAPPKPVAKPPAPAPAELEPTAAEAPAEKTTEEPAAEPEAAPEPAAAENVEEAEPAAETPSDSTPAKSESTQGTDELPPAKDELTKDNVEHLPDVSHPPPTETVASTVASSRDIGVATPLPAANQSQAPISRPAGGFATTAQKAAGVAVPRTSSFQKRLAEQQEAVVMPGHNAVDRAAVQFGSLGLNGEEAENPDVDEEREEAETRTQPPQHSPVQPRASLPPAPRQAAPAQEAPAQEAAPTPKQAPGLPPVSQQQQQQQQQQQPLPQQSPPSSLGAQPAQPQAGQQGYNQFGRYGQADTTAPPQKPYDPFGSQAPQTTQYDYNQHAQGFGQQGAYSSGPESFASQYRTSDQSLSGYQNYYQSYNQQQASAQQEAGAAQQRSGSAFGAADSSFPAGQQQSQGRYNEGQNSGHNTPNPALAGQHPSGPGSQSQHMHQTHAQPGHAGSYPGYSQHPYYSAPYFNQYMNQFGGYGGGYGGFGGKGMYSQPHYGINPQTSYDQHGSSPANVSGFGQHGRDNALGGGLGEYGRSVSGTSQNQHGAAAGGFGGLPDTFSRGQGYGSQSSSFGQQQMGQQVGADDALKPFGDSKSGPSPSALGAQQGRPGSAAQSTPSTAGQGLPPQQQGYGGYPAHLQGSQNSQYGLGGLGHQGAGSHQQGSYGSYGGFGGGYGGNYNRGGGWGASYGGGQH